MRQAGFTLIEVLIAMLVIVIGMTGLMAMQLISLRSNSRTRELTEATQLCQDRVEQLRAGPLPLPAPPSNGERIDARGCLLTGDPRAFCATPSPGQTYVRTWRADPLNARRYEVTTCWVSPPGCDPANNCAAPTAAGCELHRVVVSHVR